jgi:hypothetical protein
MDKVHWNSPFVDIKLCHGKAGHGCGEPVARQDRNQAAEIAGFHKTAIEAIEHRICRLSAANATPRLQKCGAFKARLGQS